MNVGELKKLLDKYPDAMDVLNTRFSDYELVTEDDWSVVKAVPKASYWMRSHPTMSEENRAMEREYLHLAGN
jgi:hypothetical protein